MKKPEHFLRSLNAAFPVILAVYFFVSAVAYHHCGDFTPDYLLDVLNYDWTRVVTNLLMLVPIGVSYTLSQQVLGRAIAIRVMPVALEDGAKGRFTWFALTTFQMFLGWVMANMVPLFSDFVGLMGALLSTQMSFSFPIILFIVWKWKEGKLRSQGPGLLGNCAVVFAGAIFFTVGGTISNLGNIIQNAANIAPPFGCLPICEGCMHYEG